MPPKILSGFERDESKVLMTFVVGLMVMVFLVLMLVDFGPAFARDESKDVPQTKESSPRSSKTTIV